jgi:ADP-ribose pyrophosphatase YjhB (NUDIX family)
MTDLRSGRGGIPDWLEPMVRFCSRCGGELAFGPIEGEERERLACPSCGFVCYVNPRLVVTTLPVTESGEVILIRRGIAPGLGQWAQPGGFLEIDETVRDAAIRETLEETGLEVEPGAIVGLYSSVPAAVVVVVFESRIVGGAPTITRESLETRLFAPDAIPWPDIAFETSSRALRDWVARVRPDLPSPDPSTIHRPFVG